MEGNTSSRDPNTSFWQFSDELRLHTSAFSNLSLGNSIWTDSSSFAASNPKRPLPVADDRRNFDSSADPWKMTYSNQKLAFGAFNSYSNQVSRYNTDDNNNIGGGGGSTKNSADGNRNYFNSYYNKDNNYTYGGEIKNYFNKAVGKPVNSTTPGFTNNKNNSNNDVIVAGKKKKNVNNNSGGNNNSSNNNNNDVDKRFKTLPPAEALPRNEATGGYIFVCNNETMPENLRRQIFGLPSRYRDSVRAIKPGLPLFLYNYSTHQLHGIFEAASFGGSNIDPTAWEDKKCPGESRFPAQVRVVTRKICDPLEEDAFRPILHHYDGPKFRLELNVEEALKLLDIFAENNA